MMGSFSLRTPNISYTARFYQPSYQTDHKTNRNLGMSFLAYLVQNECHKTRKIRNNIKQEGEKRKQPCEQAVTEPLQDQHCHKLH